MNWKEMSHTTRKSYRLSLCSCRKGRHGLLHPVLTYHIPWKDQCREGAFIVEATKFVKNPAVVQWKTTFLTCSHVPFWKEHVCKTTLYSNGKRQRELFLFEAWLQPTTPSLNSHKWRFTAKLQLRQIPVIALYGKAVIGETGLGHGGAPTSQGKMRMLCHCLH